MIMTSDSLPIPTGMPLPSKPANVRRSADQGSQAPKVSGAAERGSQSRTDLLDGLQSIERELGFDLSDFQDVLAPADGFSATGNVFGLDADESADEYASMMAAKAEAERIKAEEEARAARKEARERRNSLMFIGVCIGIIVLVVGLVVATLTTDLFGLLSQDDPKATPPGSSLIIDTQKEGVGDIVQMSP